MFCESISEDADLYSSKCILYSVSALFIITTLSPFVEVKFMQSILNSCLCMSGEIRRDKWYLPLTQLVIG